MVGRLLGFRGRSDGSDELYRTAVVATKSDAAASVWSKELNP